MEKFREDFLIEAISKLEKLQADLASISSLEDFVDQNFRRLHTLKGSSLAFGLDIPSKFAHEIENLFQTIKKLQIQDDIQFRDILDQSIEALSDLFDKSLKNKELYFPDDLFAEIEYLTSARKNIESFSLPQGFPDELLTQLSPHEIKNLQLAVFNEKSTFVIEVALNYSDFDDKFRALRKLLEEKGEILASLPNPKVTSSERIGFRILFVTKSTELESWFPMSQFNGEIGYKNIANPDVTFDRRELTIDNVLERTVVGGEKIAKLLEKEVEFQISTIQVEISRDLLRIISDVLLHLVRNSIDHGLEPALERLALGKRPKGVIKISLESFDKQILLKIKDDGRGIDKDKVLKLAIEKQLILPTNEITEERAWQIVFTPGFTTSQFVSEISGRGVGLEAVEAIIKKMNGEIRVHSTFGRGTEFEIYLPTN